MERLRKSAVPGCLLPMALLAGLLLATTGSAQETVIQVENVRMDYARVLRVEPVYQTLTATQIEQYCDGKPVAVERPAKGLTRIVGKVRQALGSEEGSSKPEDAVNCRAVPVRRQFRRPIAYDVDYIYKGMKYRSRLPMDPGNRLRVRVSVTPSLPPARP
jgi:uncharacterized protein YcfJ